MLSEEIHKGMLNAAARYRTKTEAAARVGIGQSLYTAYCNRRRTTGGMTVSTFEKLLPILDEVHVSYGAPPRGTIPAALVNAVKLWDRLPPDSQHHLAYMIEAVFQRHGLTEDAQESGDGEPASEAGVA